MSNKKKLNISKFIDIIKEYPVLYDRTGTLAQNNEEKNTAWKVNKIFKIVFNLTQILNFLNF